MNDSYPQITPEQRQAISASGGLPVYIEDPETHKLYLMFEQPGGPALDDAYIQEALTAEIDSLEAGARKPWDPERIKREGRQRLKSKKASQ